jgi:hypothetical protein
MRSLVSVLLLALVGTGCSDALSPEEITGRWAQDLSAVESSWEIDLTTSGANIVGTGSWYGEACCAGTLAVTGTISGRQVHLDITSTGQFPNGIQTSVSHFDGTLISSRVLEGTATYDTIGQLPQTVVYHRL